MNNKRFSFLALSVSAFVVFCSVFARAQDVDLLPPYGPLTAASGAGSSGGGGGGSGTVSAGTAPQVAYYAANGTTVSGNAALQFPATEVVVNESGIATMDFRVEGDNDANLLFADASTDRIGIGTATPSYKVEMVTAANSAQRMSIKNSTAGTSAQILYQAENDGTASFQAGVSSTTFSSASTLYTASEVFFQANSANFVIGNANDTCPFDGPNGVDPVKQKSTGGAILDRLHFYAANDGSPEVVFNEGSENYDFRVEGDTLPNLLFVDASTDRVGINTATPSHKLDVQGNSNGSERITIDNTSSGTAARAMVQMGNDGGNGFQLTQHGTGFTLNGPRKPNSSMIQAVNGNSGGGTLEILSSGAAVAGVPGSIGFWTYYGGGSSPETERMRIGYQETVVNDTGDSYDFRVEGDTNANLFVVDGSADRVGIGTNAPAATFDLRSSTGTVTYDGTNFLISNTLASGIGSKLSNFSAASGAQSYFTLEEVDGSKYMQIGYRNTGNPTSGFLTQNLGFILSGSSSVGGLAYYTLASGAPHIFGVGGIASINERMRIGNTEIVLNDNAQDVDFRVETLNAASAFFIDAGSDDIIMNDDGAANFNLRVEGDTSANLIFVLASSDVVGINTGTPLSTLHVNGTFALPIRTITTSTTATATDYTVLCDATAGAVVLTLPAVAGITNRIYNLKKIDSSANTCTLDGNASETIDGALTQVISVQWQNVQIQTNGTAWFIL